MFFFKRSILIGVAVLLALSGCGGGEDSASRVNPDSETARNVTAAAGSVCDVDIDGDVDRQDIGLITDARNNPASGPDDPRDADGNGSISVIDARSCVLQCTEPRCAIVGSGSESECADGCFPNGVAAGDVETRDNRSSVMLWTRAAFNGTVRFEYGTDPEFIQDPDGFSEVDVKYFGEDPEDYRELDPDISPPPRVNSPPAKVELTGLLPGTQYHYRVCRDDCPADVAQGTEVRGRFRTPHANGKHGLRFGVSSCFVGDLRPFVSISNVPGSDIKPDLDFFVALGDTTYADNPDHADGIRRGPAEFLQNFRKKNELVYRKVNTPEDNMFALARASTAFFATIDDHEVVNNFSGGMLARDQFETFECNVPEPGKEEPLGKCFCDVNASPVDPNCNRLVNDTDKYEAALQAFHEFNPIRKERYGDTQDDRTKNEHKLYRYRTFGKDAAIFILDTRSFRDDNAKILFQEFATLPVEAYDPARTLLGKAQLDDLLRDLRSAERDGIVWKFIMVPEPIQNIPIVGVADRFESFAHERAIILDVVETECIDNVVFISGDIHGSIANNLTYKKNFADIQRFSTTWDISTGPVAYPEPLGSLITGSAPGEPREPLDTEFRRKMDAFLIARRRPWTGLGFETFRGPAPPPQQQQNRFIPAELKKGSYVSGHSFGWTEFEIDDDQQLIVTTWGTPWYENGGDGDLDGTPDDINRFVVTPVFPANDGERCLFDKDCTSCRCSLLSSGGLLQCNAKLPDGSVCAINDQCESGRCRLLQCQAKESNGNACLTNNDCRSDRCRALRCRAKVASGNICLTNNDCRSGRCRQSGLLRRCD